MILFHLKMSKTYYVNFLIILLVIHSNRVSGDFIEILYSEPFTIYNSFINEAREAKYIKDVIAGVPPHSISPVTSRFSLGGFPVVKVEIEGKLKSLANYFNTEYDSFADSIYMISFISFDSSEITSLDSLFKGRTKLETVNFGNFSTPKLSTMNSMFYNCTNLLSSMDLSIFGPSNLKDYGNYFL